MFKKKWELNFEGHQIVAENWWNLIMKTGEKLTIDGNVVDEHTGWFSLSKELQGKISSEGKTDHVSAKFGSDEFGIKTGCHIFVNGNLLGGDTETKLLFK
ncbi:hypothetical protein HQ571_06470 [Candidatus Kuenenbacteria bacterium]|nr:hypothetical protein [Candidatus Kuenenbacteria bacterium]